MAWPLPDFPAGVKWFTAWMDTKDTTHGSNSGAGTLYCTPETAMVWTATGWLKSKARSFVRAQGGEVQMYLPYSDQTGFTDGSPGGPVINLAYFFEWVPWKAPANSTQRYVQINGADYGDVDGATVLIANLMDIGAWPHAPIKIYPPSSGGGGSTTVLVETPPGSGIYRKV